MAIVLLLFRSAISQARIKLVALYEQALTVSYRLGTKTGIQNKPLLQVSYIVAIITFCCDIRQFRQTALDWATE